jgi:hypothetical protein
MTDLANAPGGDWQSFPPDVYLDHRHRNWIISEELGDVRFWSRARVVLVHRQRAEHIVRALLGAADATRPDAVLSRAPMAPIPARLPSIPARLPSVPARLPSMSACRPVQTAPGLSRPRRHIAANVETRSPWRDLWGWVGIAAGAVMFVVALVIPLDDASLLLALALTLRGGRQILDASVTPLVPNQDARRRMVASSAA